MKQLRGVDITSAIGSIRYAAGVVTGTVAPNGTDAPIRHEMWEPRLPNHNILRARQESFYDIGLVYNHVKFLTHGSTRQIGVK